MFAEQSLCEGAGYCASFMAAPWAGEATVWHHDGIAKEVHELIQERHAVVSQGSRMLVDVYGSSIVRTRESTW
jgi:hypothetical protein